jgi:spore germination protein GerM
VKQRKARKTRLKINKWRAAVFGCAVILAALVVFSVYFIQTKEKTYKTYFIINDQIVAVEHALNKGEDPLKKGLIRLINGPSIMERTQGISTYLPQKTRINGIKNRGEVLAIDFSRELENISGGSDRIIKMIEQIVYTATETPGINKVWIFINGRKNVVLGGEGYELNGPIGREDISR